MTETLQDILSSPHRGFEIERKGFEKTISLFRTALEIVCDENGLDADEYLSLAEEKEATE